MATPPEVAPKPILDGRGAFARVDGVALVLVNVQEWTDADADQLFRETLEGGRPSAATLMHCPGAVPPAGVRRRLAELQKQLEQTSGMTGGKLAVLIDSAVARGAVTAWRWLTGGNVEAFACSDVRSAFEWLDDSDLHTETRMARYRESLVLLQRAGPSLGAPRNSSLAPS
ncbi:MAG: hypothetical protein AB8I08_19615 [Sandaracinaceae bacterium]